MSRMEQGAISAALFKPSGAGPSERGRLDTTLLKIGDLYTALQAGRGGLDPNVLLSELRVDLSLHFALEEADENFGAMARERPGIAHALDALAHEHSALLTRLDALRTSSSERAGQRELADALGELVAAFRDHERKEADLLQEFVLRDDGGPAD